MASVTAQIQDASLDAVGSDPRPRRFRLFSRGVRLWHFIVLPTLGMGLVIALFRMLDRIVPPALGPLASDLYQVGRVMAISLMMAGLIAWLAFRHRYEYEFKLHARQAALEDTRDYMARIIEGTGEAIVTRDAEGRVTAWNRAAEEIYGWSAEEMLGRDIEWLLPPGDQPREELRALEARVRLGETVRDFETSRIRKDGSEIMVRVTRSPLYDAAGRYVGSTGIVRDVTTLKEMEQRLLQRECLAAVGEMAAQVAHEIKNPLTGIRGACEIMSEDFADEHPHREIANEVVRQMDRLNQSVEDLLRFARPKPPDPQPTDIHLLLDRVIGVLEADSRFAGVRVTREYDPAISLLEVDPRQFEQVFFDLILNAVQAMDYRGTLTLATGFEDGRPVIRVRDDGPGIPDDLLERIMKPFFTTRTQGSGLGLAVVKNTLDAHDCELWVRNGDRHGAEFAVALPAPGALA